MEGWRDGEMEGWSDGGMEGWRDEGMEGWLHSFCVTLTWNEVAGGWRTVMELCRVEAGIQGTV